VLRYLGSLIKNLTLNLESFPKIKMHKKLLKNLSKNQSFSNVLADKILAL